MDEQLPDGWQEKDFLNLMAMEEIPKEIIERFEYIKIKNGSLLLPSSINVQTHKWT